MAATDSDPLIRFLLPQAHTRGAIIRGSRIFAEMKRIHGLHDGPALLLGQSLLASVLLLSVSKGGVRQVLQLDGMPENDMPIRRLFAEAGPGAVRGYLQWQDQHASSRQDHTETLTSWMGTPLHLSTIRDLGIGQPYVSTIEHDSPWLADHLLQYLNRSVQIQADVLLIGDLGLMIEAMPGSDQSHWFPAVDAMASISDERLNSESPEEILRAFDSLGCQIVGRDDYNYQCRCSKESMMAVLENMNPEQLLDLADENGEITLSCQYCDNSVSVRITG